MRWGAPVRLGAMRSARGVQFIDLGAQRTRFIRLEVLNIWGGPQAPTFYRELRLDADDAIDRVTLAPTVPAGWSVEGPAATAAAVSGVGNNTAETTSLRVPLRAGATTIRIHNDGEAAPDLDRLSVGLS